MTYRDMTDAEAEAELQRIGLTLTDALALADLPGTTELDEAAVAAATVRIRTAGDYLAHDLTGHGVHADIETIRALLHGLVDAVVNRELADNGATEERRGHLTVIDGGTA